MKIQGILPFARTLLTQTLEPGNIALDCTAGKGNDTVTLAQLVGEAGHVYSFDIQEEAIVMTEQKLKSLDLQERVTLYVNGHQNFDACLPEEHLHQIKGAIFNLGYLPGGDKSIVTKPDSTIEAINKLLHVMPKEGLIVLVIYHGHEQGQIERDHLLDYFKTIDQQQAHVLTYQFMNQKNNPPFIIAIEKR
ncbi:class I SAM-dependent methyltransferase [Alkalihalobacillus pseudalcaliphilus]|uniref:class I SAM-dependent methyltransferase n=1 Tax=Alkalihalobacillus pseudalcaliphilus TaxID=79884 RepID=UPI00064DEEA6|nr:class I SAM-dependent methyltransferase [Alkalihalobacillus pseudalcaliphilus]KMK77783.1 rRNA methyltransferase [Alkalihalobacillus pseudalcaliphilus]